ncbi:MAG: hypothetical protein WBD00_03265 [Candidatus Omnitrophota bacterium]
MVLLIKVLAIAIIVFGCLIMLRPKTMKEIIERVKKGNNLFKAMVIKIVVGVLMMIASRYCSIPWIVLFWGALNTFTGVAGLLLKRDVVVKKIEWIEKRPPKHVFLVGVSALVIGVTLVLGA